MSAASDTSAAISGWVSHHIALFTNQAIPFVNVFMLILHVATYNIYMYMYMYNIIYFSKPLRLLQILVFVACDSSFFLLCSLLSFIVVHYARDCSCTCISRDTMYVYSTCSLHV